MAMLSVLKRVLVVGALAGSMSTPVLAQALTPLLGGDPSSDCTPRGFQRAQVEAWRWTDAQGVVHFGDRRLAPPGTQPPERSRLDLRVDDRRPVADSALAARMQRELDWLHGLLLDHLAELTRGEQRVYVVLSADAGALAALAETGREALLERGRLWLPERMTLYLLDDGDAGELLWQWRVVLPRIVLHALQPRSPVWLEEGLALVLAHGLDADAAAAVLVDRPELRARALDLLRTDPEGAFLAQVVQADRARFDGDRREAMATMAWALLHVLLRRADGQDQLGRILRALRSADCRDVDLLPELSHREAGLVPLAAALRRWAAEGSAAL